MNRLTRKSGHGINTLTTSEGINHGMNTLINTKEQLMCESNSESKYANLGKINISQFEIIGDGLNDIFENIFFN